MNKFHARICRSTLVLGVLLTAMDSGPLAAQPPALRRPAAADAAQPEISPADEAHTLYALGVLINRNLQDFQLTPEEFERVKSGLIDGFEGRAAQVDLAIDSPKVQALRHTRLARVVDQRLQDGQAYVGSAAALPGARKTASGLVIVTVKPGKGVKPTKGDTVLVNYRGTLIDGTEFDASHGEPAKFALDSVIPCWSEALILMKVGEKSRVVCPPDLAYGMHGAPPKIPSQSTLDFTVELVAVAPASARATASATP